MEHLSKFSRTAMLAIVIIFTLTATAIAAVSVVPPTVITTSLVPSQGQGHITAVANLTIPFSKQMNTATGTNSNIRVYGSMTGRHTGAISWSGTDSIVTYNPAVDFKAGEVVTVTVTTGLQDAGNEPLASALVYQFTIDASVGYAKFKSPVSYTAQSGGLGDYSSVIADLNNDGKLDIATTVTLYNKMVVFMGNGDGTYAAGVNYTANVPYRIVAADIDGDGDMDLVTANNSAFALSYFTNSGGTFTRTDDDFQPSPQMNSFSLVAVDMDGDGDIDIVASDGTSQLLHVMINNGSGSFTENAYGTVAQVGPIAFGDVDKDGDMDIFAVNYSSDTVRVYNNNGAGVLSTGSQYIVGNGPAAITIADINGGNKVDFVTANAGSDNLTTFYDNFGVPLFSTSSFSVGDYPVGVTTADVDTDNDLDLLVANYNAASLMLLSNNGSGSFSLTKTYALSSYPNDVVSADLDGDGDMDVVTSNNDGKINVLLNYNGGHVTAVSPANASKNIAASSNLEITFDENMANTTIMASTVKVIGSVSGRDTGSFSYDAGLYKATFNPTNNFKPGERVTVSVTTGIQSVNGFNLERTYSSFFDVTAASGGGTLAPQTATAAGSGSKGVAVGDLNSDGYADIVTADEAADSISVMLNNGNGTFAAAVHYDAGDAPVSVAVGDIDGDGDLDIVSVGNENDFSVFSNNGSGVFGARSTVGISSFPANYIALADIDGDGDLDVTYSKTLSMQFISQTNNGSGSFSNEYGYASGNVGAAVDVDNDGDIDIIGLYNNSIFSQLNVSRWTGTFYSSTTYTPAYSPTAMVTGDFNNDGYVDVVTANLASGTGSISFMPNSGSGAFNSHTDYAMASGAQPRGMVAIDIDDDGDLDIVVGDNVGDAATIFTNDGSGVFTNAGDVATGDGPYGLAAADFDGDGGMDVVTANVNSNNVSFLKNSKAVQITQRSPAGNSASFDRSANIIITFNQAMDAASFTTSTIKVYGSVSGKVAGTVGYDTGSHAASFDPTNNLNAGERVTVLVTSGVQNLDGLSMTAPSQWTFNVFASAEGAFGMRHDYFTNGEGTQDVAVADMDGDGYPDVVTSNQQSGSVSVLLNDGSGNLGEADTSFVGANYPARVVAGDLDNDGDVDVVTANAYGGNSISVLLNDGTGDLGLPQKYSVLSNSNFYHIAIADLNRDGYNDIILPLAEQNKVAIFTNNGSGAFTGPAYLSTGSGPEASAIIDVDNDGDLDLVVTEYDNQTISVFKNNGSGTFAAGVSYSTGSNFPDNIVGGDLNGDGYPDVVVTNWDDVTRSVFLNDGTGAFPSHTDASSTETYNWSNLVDTDGDGDLDLVISATYTNKIRIYANDGSGTFASPATYLTDSDLYQVVAADMDGDGDADFVSAHYHGISVLKNIELVKVTAASPAKNALDISSSSDITVTFNVHMDDATLVDSTVVVSGSISGKVNAAYSYDDPSKTLTIDPDSLLKPGEVVTVAVSTDAKNNNGIPMLAAFSSSFTVHAPGTGYIAFRDSLAISEYINALEPADIDGDGDMDLVAISSFPSGQVIAYTNNGSGIFSASSIGSATNPSSLKVCDIDNDGDIDVVWDNSYGSSDVHILLNDGAANFSDAGTVNLYSSDKRYALRDVNGDGRLDFIFQGGNAYTYVKVQEDGLTFTDGGSIEMGYGGIAFENADVNNDGIADLVTASNNGSDAPGTVSVRLGVGGGSFGSLTSYSTGIDPGQLAAVDLDADGKIDFVTASRQGYTFSTLKGNGDGAFATHVDYAIGHNRVNQMRTGDVDGDGDIDLIFLLYDDAADWGDQFLIAYNDGAGSFNDQALVRIPSEDPYYYYGSQFFAATDMDGDGDLDLVSSQTNGSNQFLTFYQNGGGSVPAPATSVTGISVGTNYGSKVTLNWTNDNATRHLVVIKAGSAVDATLSDAGGYPSNATFGSGPDIGGGNYVVYGGGFASATISGLSTSSTYHVAVYSLNGPVGAEVFSTGSPATAYFSTAAHAGFPFDTAAGKALSFDGSSSVATYSVDDITQKFTASMWVKTTDSSATAAFFTRGEEWVYGGGGGDRAFPSGKNALVKKVNSKKSNEARLAARELHRKKVAGKQHAVKPGRGSKAKVVSVGEADYYNPIHLGFTNGHVYASVYDDDEGEAITIVGNTDVSNNQWYNVALTFSWNYDEDGDASFHLFVNGKEDADSGYVSYFNDGGDAWDLGYDGDVYFSGEVDELLIRNTVQTTSQIRASMHQTLSGFPTDITGYWQFNEGSGTTATSITDGAQFNMEGLSWVISSAPVGAGTASSISSFTTGQQTAGNVTLDMADGFDNPVDVVVTEVSGNPNTFPDGYSVSVGGKVFVIELFGDPGTFTASLTLNFGVGNITSGQESDPSSLRLFHRAATSTGAWTDLGGASTAVAATGDVTWTGITSFSQFIVGDVNSPTPVELNSFVATTERMAATLQWTTATEVNSDGFEIERRALASASGSKTGSWSKVGFVQGAGTSNSPKQYSFTDNVKVSGRYAYRLKQVDKDGKFKYSAAVELEVGLAPKEFALSQNYPNPFNPSTTIEFSLPEDGRATLKVYNMLGQEVASLVNEDLKAGVYQRATFDASRLATGMYFARLEFGGKQLMKKMLLVK